MFSETKIICLSESLMKLSCIKGSPNSSPDIRFTNVEFDDGDSGKIPLDHIRQLPSDFPLVCKYFIIMQFSKIICCLPKIDYRRIINTI